ncbi:MAG TPA: hypothetical protein VHH73_13365 [Verrucomicrobiae bacterium]|nr:hypothetical protein [Verrucomicrobiae bacterium]
MKTKAALLAATLLLPALAFATDYNLGKLADAGKITVFNRALDHVKAGAPGAVFLNAAPNDGVAWIDGAVLGEGTIELEIRGKDVRGQSFVGIAFHGKDDKTFDAVYLRPFNFQSVERGDHAIQYISMPDNDWNKLRANHPGKYEQPINPAPSPDVWVTLKLVVGKKNVAAFVNGSQKPALTVDLLNERSDGKLGLWVGNGSDGWFRNLKVTAKQ